MSKPEGPKTIMCAMCGRKFATVAALERHANTEHGVK